MTRYGFLGIGIMGRAMAANLLHAGFSVTVWNRTRERCTPLVDMGAETGNSPAEVLATCDITFAMVSDPAAAMALCFDDEGVLAGMAPGKTYVDVSTVDPETATIIGQAVNDRGGLFLEAPVSGSKKPAEDGALVFLCAGDRQAYDAALPALEVMGKKSFYFPAIGQGAQMKLVINMIMGTMMTAFAEGLSLGNKMGLQMTDIVEVLGQGAIDCPMFKLKGPLMIEGNFGPAFPLKHMQKDMRLALAAGDRLHQDLPTATIANEAYLRALAANCGDEDFSAVLKQILH